MQIYALERWAELSSDGAVDKMVVIFEASSWMAAIQVKAS